MVSSAKVSRPLTAYYSSRVGKQVPRTAKLSERLTAQERQQLKEEQDHIEEVVEAESQIEWFEKNNIDPNKKNRYANINLELAVNYE